MAADEVLPPKTWWESLADVRYEIRDLKRFSEGTSQCAYAKATEVEIVDLKQAIVLLTKQAELNRVSINKLDETLYGNGKIGLKENVQTLLSEMKLFKFIAATIAISLIGLLVTAIYNLVIVHGALP